MGQICPVTYFSKQFYWDTAMPVSWHIAYKYFHSTMADKAEQLQQRPSSLQSLKHLLQQKFDSRTLEHLYLQAQTPLTPDTLPWICSSQMPFLRNVFIFHKTTQAKNLGVISHSSLSLTT